ncbi:MAG: hypothetical protein JXR69_03000 [Candidatus Delongbacteria bacterium]|nr:hypothetical protein [Candidatus Delongbacteria bacterium]
MKRCSVVVFTIVLAFVFTGCIDLSTQEENKNKIAKLEAKIDSLETVIAGKKSKPKTKSSTSTSTNTASSKGVFNKSSANITAIIADVEEYLEAVETAKAYERRGKSVSAKEFYDKSDEYKSKVEKLFAKDAVITLDFSMKKNITQNYMFQEKSWKLRTQYYSSVNPGGKPKDWLTSDKQASRLESLIQGRKYRVKFKVLEPIAMPYGGTMSYFTMHVKYLDIRPIE